MTEATEHGPDSSPDPDDDFVGDVFLAALISSMIDRGGPDAAISMTVTIPGGTLGGDVVSFKTWRDLNAELLRNVGSDGATGLALTFDSSVWDEHDSVSSSDQDRPLPRYIHFKDATLYDGTVVRQFGLWRGRLSEVSGWRIGRPS